jgi:hypothetical protein
VAAPVRHQTLKVGDAVALDIRRKGPTLSVGEPGVVALLKRLESGKYRVERIIRVQ